MTIAAESLSIEIAGRVVVREVSLSAQPGKITALTGPSGSGKTTLLSALGLLLNPTSGRVTVEGHDSTGWRDSKRLAFWRDSAAFIYQDYGLLDDKPVAYNVAMRPVRSLRRRADRWREVLDSLDHVGLQGRELDLASVLSGGEKQRVGVARAIYKKASVIFADEPTASLDAANRDAVVALLTGEARRGAAIVVATHDEYLCERADTVVELAAAA